MSLKAQPRPDPARELILTRVRDALGEADDRCAPQTTPREYRRQGTLAPEPLIELLCERIGDYRAEVRRVSSEGLAAEVADVFHGHRARRICVPAGVPSHWRHADGFEWVVDSSLAIGDLDRVDGVLTGSTLAIAETGTIALSGSPLEGRRAITLVPDLHVCVVAEEQVVETVPEAIAPLAALVAAERRPITLISGPSATSDIELSRVEGVHGPRRLVVLVVARGR